MHASGVNYTHTHTHVCNLCVVCTYLPFLRIVGPALFLGFNRAATSLNGWKSSSLSPLLRMLLPSRRRLLRVLLPSPRTALRDLFFFFFFPHFVVGCWCGYYCFVFFNILPSDNTADDVSNNIQLNIHSMCTPVMLFVVIF